MSETSSADRRRATRRETGKAIALVVDSGRGQISNQAFAVNLSELGARVRAQVHLEPGQRVTVIPLEGKAYAVPSRVIWVHPAGLSGGGEAGIAFLEPQAPESALFSRTQ
ncbi:MAG: PilZ domain-containing protein [Acidobacteriota bacterium]|nr:PilZ domain-containing protein [Acidobacteriota bacterium]